MPKYTDERLKKALECCINKRTMCKQCPLYSIDILNCNEKVAMAYALDLINRQEAEIERLKEKNRLANQCTPKAIRRARAEAIKEFSERLKEKAISFIYHYSEYGSCRGVSIECIDNLVKEMVGESKNGNVGKDV